MAKKNFKRNTKTKRRIIEDPAISDPVAKPGEVRSAGAGFAGSVYHSQESASFLDFSNAVVSNLESIVKNIERLEKNLNILAEHVEKMNDGWTGDK